VRPLSCNASCSEQCDTMKAPTFETATGAFAFAQQQFENAYNKAASDKSRIDQELEKFKRIAFALKGLAVFGGLLITSGFIRQYDQVLGFAISVAVAYDAFVSNHKRTMSRAAASGAFRQMLATIHSRHTDALERLLPKKNTPEFEPEAVQLLGDLRRVIEKTSEDIASALEKSDTDALQALAVESGDRKSAA
jgi:hypothetical protein